MKYAMTVSSTFSHIPLNLFNTSYGPSVHNLYNGLQFKCFLVIRTVMESLLRQVALRILVNSLLQLDHSVSDQHSLRAKFSCPSLVLIKFCKHVGSP
jgi:hypothetical protein